MVPLSLESEYNGSLSPLTRYGTMLVSEARIPRKKRSRGNVAQPRTRVYGYAPTPEGEALALEGICTVLVKKPGQPDATVLASSFHAERTRTASTTRTLHEAKVPESARLAPITEGAYS